jgi:mannose-1-phosphate guanylyltransferase
MAGGVGSRFWPLSTPERPKQFIDVLGCGRSLIQLTVDRFEGVCRPENFWVVTNAAYVDTVREQLPDIPEDHILPEPAARNTAPCIAWACWRINQIDPQATIVVTPSDAVVMNPVEFRRVIVGALDFAAGGERIVTVGIRPSRPETGYGYVEVGEAVDNCEICKVAAFKEKPDQDTAMTYVQSGRYLWNAGIFVWNISTIVEALRRYKPGIASDMDRMLETGDVQGIFPQCEKISIDFAVMEPAAADGKVYTHPADFGWSDLGNWASLHDKLQKDENGNASVGSVTVVECKDCVIHAEDAGKVILQGLDGYIVSLKNGQLLVCRRSEEQRIKEW